MSARESIANGNERKAGRALRARRFIFNPAKCNLSRQRLSRVASAASQMRWGEAIVYKMDFTKLEDVSPLRVFRYQDQGQIGENYVLRKVRNGDE